MPTQCDAIRLVPKLATVLLLAFLTGCGGGKHLRPVCDGADDPECPNAKLKRPSFPNRRVSRPGGGEPLAQLIKDMRARDPELPTQVTLSIDKSERTLTVKLGEETVRSYGVSLGFAPEGDKTQEGDGKTPEGTYYVGYGAPPRSTQYHRALLVSYPGVEQAEKGFASGAINAKQLQKIKAAHQRCYAPPQRTNLGGYVMIHGGGGGAGYGDWTLGCIALTNEDIEEIHSVSKAGCRKGEARTKLEIVP